MGRDTYDFLAKDVKLHGVPTPISAISDSFSKRKRVHCVMPIHNDRVCQDLGRA